MAKALPMPERFWSKVDTRGEDDCWPWLASRTGGYGVFLFQGRYEYAHRVAYFLLHGVFPMPYGCHTCDHPWCCNPAHVFAGTNADNMRDASRKGRLRWPGLSGEAHPAAKLTDWEVERMRFDANLGVKHAALARRYGVTQTRVAQIVRWGDRAYRSIVNIANN